MKRTIVIRTGATNAILLKGEYVEAWIGSPFAWILLQPSWRRCKMGKQLASGFLAARDINVGGSPDSEADRLINGHRAKIRFSMLKKSDTFTFRQICDQNYEFAICLGLCPFDTYCWVVPKEELLRHVIGHTGQHGGAGGTDTAWMSFGPDDPYEWLRPYGGRLRDAIRVLRETYPLSQRGKGR